MSDHLLGVPAAVLAEQIGRPERWVRVSARKFNWPRVEIGRAMFFPTDAIDAIKARHAVGAPVPVPGNPHGRSTRRRTP